MDHVSGVAPAHVLRSVSRSASAFRESSIALTMNALFPTSFIEHPMCQHAVSSMTMKRSWKSRERRVSTRIRGCC